MRMRGSQLRDLCLHALGAKCAACGIARLAVLQIDHVAGGGRRERAACSSKRRYYRRVLASIVAGEVRFQALCANCHLLKGE